MRKLSKLRFWTLLALPLAACGSNDDGTMAESSETAGAAAGKTAGTAGKVASAGTNGTAKAGTGANSAGSTGIKPPTAGSKAQPSAAGKSGSAAAGADADADAGVMPAAGSSGGMPAAGAGGAAGRASQSAGTSGSTAAAGSGGTAASAATFTQVYALFSTGCAGATCHVAANRPAEMLDMSDKATAYENLVGVDARACAGETRVVAGDPDKSELVHTLARTTIGSCARTPRMPEGKPQLGASDIALVSSWIKAGAKND